MVEKQRPYVEQNTSCACGGVQLAVKGPALSMLLCCCRDCQKTRGAGHSAIAIFRGTDVTISGPTTSFAVTANSGATMTRQFCPVCGTAISGQSSRWAEAKIIPVGLFEDQSWFNPAQVIFNRSHQHWDVLPDVPTYETYRGE